MGGRYHQEAYVFVMAALSRSLRGLEKPRHVTGGELLRGIRQEAEERFGPMAAAVFEHWGVKNSLDFGRIVFNMVDEGILFKTETDTLEDFNDDVFFNTLFDHRSGYRLPEEEKPLKKVLK
ncbi:MAG: Minf_1886 family protein [Candidatus Omnitrophota bacterium]